MKNKPIFNYGPIPNDRQLEWYDRGLMAFIHFGMNTFTDMEWGEGDASPDIFNPTELDCRQWIKNLKEAGFTSAILTVKHHDGFCLWQSEYTDYCVKSSKWKEGKSDVFREFTDACREFGLKAGFYLSPWDRHEKTYGTPAYTEYYNNQLKELLTNYGKIWDVWWDGAGSMGAAYDWSLWENTVHTLQPDAVIFGAMGSANLVDVRWVGNEKGMAGKPCFANIDVSSIFNEITSELNTGKFDGEKFAPAEVDVSIRPGWFYHKEQDEFVRSPENLMNLWFSSIGRNAGLLLNFPPDKRGKINEKDFASAKAFYKNLRESFENNLLENADIKVSSLYSDEYKKENILLREKESIFAFGSEDKNPEIEFIFNKKIKFNAVKISEAIKYGHHIKGFTLSAYTENGWLTFIKGECIGNMYAESFGEIETDRIKLNITDFASIPLIDFMGVYNLKIGEEKGNKAFKKDILKNSAAKIIQDKNSMDINLGGIYPFNFIKFDSAGLESYELWVFNGSELEFLKENKVKSDTEEIKLEEIIDYAYRLVLKFKLSSSYEFINRNAEIYLI
ncbi:MAG: hypothetical protein E7564_10040 [Ruminococcaceae bacterium]|nr:hypothetical protein [Oscillospiraceae bacterium]